MLLDGPDGSGQIASKKFDQADIKPAGVEDQAGGGQGDPGSPGNVHQAGGRIIGVIAGDHQGRDCADLENAVVPDIGPGKPGGVQIIPDPDAVSHEIAGGPAEDLGRGVNRDGQAGQAIGRGRQDVGLDHRRGTPGLDRAIDRKQVFIHGAADIVKHMAAGRLVEIPGPLGIQASQGRLDRDTGLETPGGGLGDPALEFPAGAGGGDGRVIPGLQVLQIDPAQHQIGAMEAPAAHKIMERNALDQVGGVGVNGGCHGVHLQAGLLLNLTTLPNRTLIFAAGIIGMAVVIDRHIGGGVVKQCAIGQGYLVEVKDNDRLPGAQQGDQVGGGRGDVPKPPRPELSGFAAPAFGHFTVSKLTFPFQRFLLNSSNWAILSLNVQRQ